MDGLLLGLIFIFFVAVWIYADAKENKIDSPWMWAILTFLIAIIGIPLYLIERGKVKGKNQQKIDDSLTVLNMRLANGEINAEEYYKLKKIIRE